MNKITKNEQRCEGNVITATMRVSIAVVVIKMLGFIKQVVIASRFGASVETDAFFISTGVIGSLANVVFSAISITLLSIYTQRVENVGKAKAGLVISATLKVFIPISFLLGLSFALFAPVVGKILAPSYEGAALNILVSYIRIMAGGFIFNCYYLTLNVILESDKRFLPGKGQAFFQNFFLILAAVFFSNHFGVKALVVAYIMSFVAQCILIRICTLKRYKFEFNTVECRTDIQKLLKLSLPLIVGNAVYEINDIVDKQISSGLGNGGASILSYGASINEIVTTVIIMSLSTVLYAYYASWVAKGQYERIGKNIIKSIEYLTVIITPILVVCLICGKDIVEIIYGRGNFGELQIEQTYRVMVGYAVGFMFQAARATIVKVFYAFNNTKIPMVNGTISVGFNIILSIILSHVMGVAGISLATSISMLIATVLLIVRLPLFIKGFSLYSSIPEYIKSFVAGAISLICLVLLYRNTDFTLYIRVIAGIILVMFIYMIILILLKSKCSCELINICKKRLLK